MPADQIIYGVLIPAAVAGAVLLIAWLCAWMMRRRPAAARSAQAVETAAAALAVAFAYIAGHVLLLGWRARPVEPWQWLPYMAITGAALAIIAASARLPAPALLLSEGVFYALALFLLMRPYPWESWTVLQAGFWLGGLWLAVAVVVAAAEFLARRIRWAGMALLAVIAGTACSVVAVCSSNAKLGQLAGVLTSAAGALMVAGLLRPRLTLAGGGARVITFLLLSILLIAYHNDYAGLSPASFLLVGAALPAGLAAEIPFMKKLKPWQAFLLRLLAVAAAAGAGTALAWRAYAATDSESGYY